MNWYFYLVVVVIACGGIPKGYDEGGFSAAVGLPSFKTAYGIDPDTWQGSADGLANRRANISSFGVLGAAIGSVVSLLVNDRLGRLRSWQLFVVWWATGNLMQVFSSGIFPLMLFARIWGGIGAGGSTVATPLFLSEVAPAKSRGAIVSLYMVILLTSLAVGFFVNYGAEQGLPDDSSSQYRLVVAIPLIPVGAAFLASFFISDTPAWLASKGRRDDALNALRRLRQANNNEEELSNEMEHMVIAMEERNHEMEGVSMLSALKDMLTNTSYRKRFILAMFMQTVAQWSGGNGVTYYVPEIFNYAGLQGSGASLITSGAYGITKLVFTMVFAWGLVDVFGRRRCGLVGVFLQAVGHIYLAVYLSSDSLSNHQTASNAAIAVVFIYAIGWSIGLCTIQYLYATEIFPTRIRGVAYAINMVLHWFFQFAVVRVTPNMFVAWDVWGAFVFWACICAVGLVGIGIAAPETRRVSMEDMDALFSGKWYMAWNAKPPVPTVLHFDPKDEHKIEEEHLDKV